MRNPYLIYPPYPEEAVSLEDIQNEITQLADSGDINNEDAAHDLELHLKVVPLLGLGGPEKVENLQKVKLKEHILLISEFMGPIK